MGAARHLSRAVSGARKVICTTPGWRPISIPPVMVARFITSGTVIERSLAARRSPTSVALFRFGPDPTIEIGADSSILASPHVAARMACPLHFRLVQGSGERREILKQRKQNRPFQSSSLQEVDPQSHGAGDIHGVAGDFAVPLHRVHVAKVNSGTRNFDGSDHDRPGSDGVDVHVAVRAKFKLFSRDGIFVRRTDQSGTEVACVVRIGHPDGGRGSQLTQKRAKPHSQSNQVMRRIM